MVIVTQKFIGSFGEVYLCYHKKTGCSRAVKILPKVGVDERERRKYLREINSLKIMDHPNIMRLFETFDDSKRFYLVTEYYIFYYRLCMGGDVLNLIEKRKRISENEIADIMRQLLSAVAYLHSKNIAHRDLKPENMLFASLEDLLSLKIIDFGSSEIYDTEHKMDAKVGTPFYMAPEMIKKQYTEKCDIWSCGVILYYLLSGTQPFFARNERDVFKKIQNGTYALTGIRWSNISTKAKQLIKKMLVTDPIKRYNAIEALNSSWIQNINKDKINIGEAKIQLNNLCDYKAKHKLQQAALTFIVSQLISSKEKDRFQKMFVLLDDNKDGKVSKEELINGYNKIFSEEHIHTSYMIYSLAPQYVMYGSQKYLLQVRACVGGKGWAIWPKYHIRI